jgi:hypothetical protein
VPPWSKLDHLGCGLAGKEIGPLAHELAALHQRIVALVGLLGLVVDRMREGGLGDLARKPRLAARPAAELEQTVVYASTAPSSRRS